MKLYKIRGEKMLFKNYIYVNEKLLEKLSKQLGIKISYDTTKQINKKLGIGGSQILLGAEKLQVNTENLKNDKYDLLELFEKKVTEDETGIVEFDFEDASYILPGQLIKFTAKLVQPKGNDNLELVTSIKQNPIFSGMVKENIDVSNENDQKLVDLIFGEGNDIPVYFSNDENYIVVSNISTDYLDIEYEDFSDLYDEEVTAVLLVDRKFSEQQEVVLMDIMKDIFKIGRDLRRTMPKTEQEKYIIKERGPAIKGEILAMYN